MRRLFANLLHQEMKKNQDIVLLTGDLGYKLWDQIKTDFPERFINPGSAEQLMVGMSVGLSLEGKIPVIYSITPFLLYRPFEIIRNYANHEKIAIKLVGGGRNRDYGVAGYTHWAEEDSLVMKALPNIITNYPETDEQMASLFLNFLYDKKPHYLNLRK